MKPGYAITTYKIQLNYKHLDWFKQTQSLFDDVLAFYYHLIETQPQVLELSNQNLLRHLELQTIKQRDGTLPQTPIPFEKVPLYFRRAAINAAISMYRSYVSKLKAWGEKQIENGECRVENDCAESLCDSDSNQIGKADLNQHTQYSMLNAQLKKAKPLKGKPSAPARLHVSMLYYKGMYKDFENGQIMLKLYTGKAWSWVKHHYTGRPFPKNAELMSPTVVIKKKKVMLHIPVKEEVADTRSAKERVEQAEKFVAVALTGSDTLAVCTTIEPDGSATHPFFIKDGKELAHRRKQVLGYVKRGSKKSSSSESSNLSKANQRVENGEWRMENGSPESQSDSDLNQNAKGILVQNLQPSTFNFPPDIVVPKPSTIGRPNAKLYEKITRLTDHYAHMVSRKIVDYAKAQGAKLIVLPDLQDSFNLRPKAYLGKTPYDFIGRRIVRYAIYKAWQQGIVTMTSKPYHTSTTCSHCGSEISKYNTEYQAPTKNFYGGKNFVCPEGHRGSTALNSARNLGKNFYNTFYPSVA